MAQNPLDWSRQQNFYGWYKQIVRELSKNNTDEKQIYNLKHPKLSQKLTEHILLKMNLILFKLQKRIYI